MSAPTPHLVQEFYDRIWNGAEFEAAPEIIAEGFVFRGSLGADLRGREAFLQYVRSVREALADYRCDILECVADGDRAFAKMRFGGRHVGAFRRFDPTGKPVHWLGAALFRFEVERIVELWVLGDLAGLDEVLRANAASRHP
jgi:predicted ester cyclase